MLFPVGGREKMEKIKQTAGLEKQSLIADLEQAVETLHENAERIQELEKKWNESEWYLGEARARNQHLDDELRERDHRIFRLEEERRTVRQQLEETQWYLEEAKARCRDLEALVDHLKGQLGSR